jgi:hypothetical protein
VQEQMQQRAGTLNLQSLLQSLRTG